MTNFFNPFQILLVLISINSSCHAQSTAQKLDQNMTLKKIDMDSVVWFDPREEPFELAGFEWIKQDNVFRRLPLHPKWKIPKEVDDLANQTAGGQIRFKTDSKRILLKVQLSEKSSMYHMPATGQSGFDLYVRDGNVQKYLKTTRFPHDTLQYQVELYNVSERQIHDFTINFPLYNGVNSVLVGLEQKSSIDTPKAFSLSGKIVIYGTSITQGGCVSRPGMLFSNILSRKLDVEFVNLGFSGNGKGEPELAQLINQISDTNLIILDYEANAGETIKNTLEQFINILRKKHPVTPILIVSKIRYADESDGSSGYKQLISNRDFQRDLIKDRKSKGDKNIYFLDGSTILGDDYYECTVDGVHPSDLGSYRIADALLPVIKGIIISH